MRGAEGWREERGIVQRKKWGNKRGEREKVSDERYSIFTWPESNVLAHAQTQTYFTSSFQEDGTVWSPMTSICDITHMFLVWSIKLYILLCRHWPWIKNLLLYFCKFIPLFYLNPGHDLTRLKQVKELVQVTWNKGMNKYNVDAIYFKRGNQLISELLIFYFTTWEQTLFCTPFVERAYSFRPILYFVQF